MHLRRDRSAHRRDDSLPAELPRSGSTGQSVHAPLVTRVVRGQDHALVAPPRQPAAWRLVNKYSDRLHRAPASTPTTSACRYRFIRSLLVTRRALLAAAEAAVAGRDSVTPEKKPSSRVAARKELALTQLSTPRAIARVRGKALHYDRAIPLVAVAVPSLAQPVHGRETCSGPVDVPVLDDETGWNSTGTGSSRSPTARCSRWSSGASRWRSTARPVSPVVPSSG